MTVTPGDVPTNYCWTLTGNTVFTNDVKTTNTTSSSMIVYETGQGSSSYKGESINVQVLPSGFSINTNFTVVKANIEWPDLVETNEETVGAWVSYNGDDDDTNGVVDAEQGAMENGIEDDDLVEIALNLEPEGLPTNETVTVTCEDCWLDRGKQTNAAGSYTSDKFPLTVYVEGKTISQAIRDQSMIVSNTASGACDLVKYTALSVDIVPDWNHDREINSADENQATASNPFRFWINDDDDSGDVAEGDSDLPGHWSWGTSPADYSNDKVDGRCDLLDFSAIRLDLHDTLNLLPPSDSVQYKLKQASGAVRAVYTDLTKGSAGDFLTTEGNTYGPSFNQNSYEADAFEVTSSGVTLSTNFLDKIKNNASKGILLMEGAASTTSPLVLEVWKDGMKICETELPLSVDGVEMFYRWINVRDVAGGSESRDTDTAEPDNYPDSYCSGKQFIFVHGYSVHEEAARAWNAEMFKRLYQSGSRAMFTAVTWRGNDGQLADWIPFVGGSTPDYYVNVEHAFETASNLVSIINASIPGSKHIAGHSLGNMVVSSAIKDHALSVNTYFMLNAAVAMEAYDASFDNRNIMRHPDWQSYTNYHLWASEWHQLFPTNDGRGKLTWRGKFNTVSNAFNYYSSTEDVLNNADGNLPAIGTEQAWVNQEMRKGTTLMWIAPGNQEGGWGFNEDYEDLTVAEANALPDSTVKTNSFFGHFDNEDLYGTNGSAVAEQPATQRQLLGDAIPALSNPAGRNSIDSAAGQGNRDYMTYNGGTGFRRGLWENGDWPQQDNRWRHSDLKRVAYPYNSEAFDQIVTDGGLR